MTNSRDGFSGLLYKVTQSQYKPEQALKDPGIEDCQNSFVVGIRKWQICQHFVPSAFTSKEIFPIPISVRG